MAARLIRLCFFLPLLAAGCASSDLTPRPPSSLPSTNAAVKDYAPLYSTTRPAHADVTLTARCRASDRFAQQRHGKWNHNWYLITLDVLRVEQGHWPHATVSFVCMDAWPTPESGIMIDKDVWPYRPGAVLRLWLDTSHTPGTIIGQERLPSPPP